MGHDLLQQSIHRYRHAVTVSMQTRLAQALSARRFIEEILHETTQDTQPDGGQWGCLVMNCASEFARSDAAVAGLVMDSIRSFEAVFRRAVERAQQGGRLCQPRKWDLSLRATPGSESGAGSGGAAISCERHHLHHDRSFPRRP